MYKKNIFRLFWGFLVKWNKKKNKYDYDSDEEIDPDEGTWEHRMRRTEMVATKGIPSFLYSYPIKHYRLLFLFVYYFFSFIISFRLLFLIVYYFFSFIISFIISFRLLFRLLFLFVYYFLPFIISA